MVEKWFERSKNSWYKDKPLLLMQRLLSTVISVLDIIIGFWRIDGNKCFNLAIKKHII